MKRTGRLEVPIAIGSEVGRLVRNSFPPFLFSFLLLCCGFSSFAQLTVTSTITPSTCSYDSTGSVSVVVSGGTIPYTYLWSPGGEATASVTGLPPGTYGLNIKDNAGADTTVSFVVGPIPMANDTASAIEFPFCDANGSIVLSISGGTGAYQYAWSNGSPNVGISQLAAGDYSVIVTDANSCTAAFSFSLLEKKCFVDPTSYFTPNGDGFNDTWQIANSQFFPDARLIVFDRWGMKVYEHKGTYEEWDGKSFLGVAVPDAAYYYFFYEDKDDKQKASKHGSVIILR